MCIKRRFQKHSPALDGYFSPINKEQGSKQSIPSCIDVREEKRPPNLPDVVSLLKACAQRKDLLGGIRIHDLVVNLGCLQRDIYVRNALINLYAKCGELMKAQNVFDTIRAKDVVTWTTLIGAYTHHGDCELCLALFYRMRAESLVPDAFTFVHILKACGNSIGISNKGERIHVEVIYEGFVVGKDPFVGIAVLDMYAKCGAFLKARQVLDTLWVQNVIAWNALIAGYARHNGIYGSYQALNLYDEMQLYGISPDSITFVCILKVCGALGAIHIGVKIHANKIVREELQKCNILLGNALINMYAKCGAIQEAHKAFGQLPIRNVASWSTLFSGYVENGQCEKALDLFEKMQRDDGIRPDVISFVCILRACGIIGALNKGEEIHSKICQIGLSVNNLSIGNAVVDMYAKCGKVEKAREMFDQLSNPDSVSWSIIIAGYMEHGHSKEALECFEEIQKQGFCIDALTYVNVSKACGAIGDFRKGFEVHDEVIREGFLEDPSLGTALVDMYAKCGVSQEAHQVFNQLQVQNLIAWSALIGGYADLGHGTKAVNCYKRLLHECVNPDSITFVCALKACGNIKATEKGKEIHVLIKEMSLEEDVLVANALLDVYSKCGRLKEAKEVFEQISVRNVISWNALIMGYAQYGHCSDALNFFDQMKREGLTPSPITFVSALKACGTSGEIEKGKYIHTEVLREGLLQTDVYIGNALVDMYVKCGQLLKANKLLDELGIHNVVTWNSLISGYAQHEQKEAMESFEKMQQMGITPDRVTYVAMVKACGSTRSVTKGKEIHAMIVSEENDLVIGNAIVSMYAKCGAPEKAHEVFEELPVRDESSWTSLITSYSLDRKDTIVVDLFNQMMQESIHPDILTFTVVLNACSHAGLVDEAKEYFASMTTNYGIIPTLEHHTCMIDLFGRSGHFDEAVEAIKRMPTLDYLPMWSSLLGSCKKWGNVEVGKLAFDHCVQLDEHHVAGYVNMRNIFAADSALEENQEPK